MITLDLAMGKEAFSFRELRVFGISACWS